MPPSSRTSRHARTPDPHSAAGPTSWSSRAWTPETSPTNWCSGWRVPTPLVRSCKELRVPATVFRAARPLLISFTSPVSSLCRRCLRHSNCQAGSRESGPMLRVGCAMSFDVKKQGDITVIDVEGQLIVGNRQELKQKVLEELEKGARKFLIDFSSTGYIDSSGLGVLVSLSKKIREQGGELRLANLNEDLRTLFELTKLDTLFHIATSREDALSSF